MRRVRREGSEFRPEWLEVINERLVDEDIPIRPEQYPLYDARLPQPPYDLECGIGLAGAGGHDEQYAARDVGDRLDSSVDGIHLVVARLLARGVIMVRLKDEFFRLVSDAAELLVALPQLLRRRKGFERKLYDRTGFIGIVCTTVSKMFVRALLTA